MNAKASPTYLDLVLVGGGHAHVHVLKMLGMPVHRRWVLETGIQVTLIARDIHTPYSGMLPGFVSGHYTYDDIHLDLVKLCRFSNTRLIHAAAHEVTYNSRNGGAGMVFCSDGRPPIRFDALSIDIGITPSIAWMSETSLDSIIPVKPIAHFCNYYRELQKTVLRKCRNATANKTNGNDHHKYVVAVVGGGAGGTELAMSMDFYFHSQGLGDSVDVVICTRGKTLLDSHNKRVQNIFKRILKERNINVYFQAEVVGVERTNENSQGRSRLVLSSATQYYHKEPIVVDDILWCTEAAAASWLSENTPFKTTKEGNFLEVSSTYQSVSHKGVFACGDCCHMVDNPRPKAGVFAVRAGPPLLQNLKNYLSNKPLQQHVPQKDFLGLISTGNKYAVASKGWWFAMEGAWLWHVKDYIDRTWMEKYTVLPDLGEMMSKMSSSSGPSNKRRRLNVLSKGKDVIEAFSADLMRCGGCGAKVGTTTVSTTLSAVHKRQIQRAKLLQLPNPPPIDHDDAAIIALPNRGGGAILQSIDYFRSLLDDPFLFGKIVAVHSLSDVHAMGATAQSALALAVVPFAADEAITESLLIHLLSGVSDIIQAEGVHLVGGHTCEGVELACGLSVQGYTENPDKLLRKRGGRVGDRIVLTKALGTGALFAADMRAKCRGEYVAQAIESMIQSNAAASRIAMESAGVHACTDCTGFGLMGHLLEMLMANETVDAQSLGFASIGALLRVHDMQFLKGGVEASSNGIYSTLQPANQRSRRAVINDSEATKAYPIKYPLLFDPQTAGGLVFFVDPENCNEFVSELKDFYPTTAVIGELVKYPENEVTATALTEGICPIGSSGTSTGQRVRIDL